MAVKKSDALSCSLVALINMCSLVAHVRWWRVSIDVRRWEEKLRWCCSSLQGERREEVSRVGTGLREEGGGRKEGLGLMNVRGVCFIWAAQGLSHELFGP